MQLSEGLSSILLTLSTSLINYKSLAGCIWSVLPEYSPSQVMIGMLLDSHFLFFCVPSSLFFHLWHAQQMGFLDHKRGFSLAFAFQSCMLKLWALDRAVVMPGAEACCNFANPTCFAKGEGDTSDNPLGYALTWIRALSFFLSNSWLFVWCLIRDVLWVLPALTSNTLVQPVRPCGVLHHPAERGHRQNHQILHPTERFPSSWTPSHSRGSGSGALHRRYQHCHCGLGHWLCFLISWSDYLRCCGKHGDPFPDDRRLPAWLQRWCSNLHIPAVKAALLFLLPYSTNPNCVLTQEYTVYTAVSATFS